jgi:hypothetical protein
MAALLCCWRIRRHLQSPTLLLSKSPPSRQRFFSTQSRGAARNCHKSLPLARPVPILRHRILIASAIQNKTPNSHSEIKQAGFQASPLAFDVRHQSPKDIAPSHSMGCALPPRHAGLFGTPLAFIPAHVSDIRRWPTRLREQRISILGLRRAEGKSQREFCFMTKPYRSCIPTGRDSVPAGSRPHFFVGVQALTCCRHRWYELRRRTIP